MKMKILSRLAMAATLSVFYVAAGLADTLELKDGRVLQGKYLGGTQTILRFEVNGDVQTFPTNTIVALTFTHNSAPPAPAPQAQLPQAPSPQAALPPSAAPANSYAGGNGGGDITLPAGQSMLVRMIDGVDSSKNHVG